MHIKLSQNEVELLLKTIEEAAIREGNKRVKAITRLDNGAYLEAAEKKSMLRHIYSTIKNAVETEKTQESLHDC